MAGILGIYGLIVAVIIAGGVKGNGVFNLFWVYCENIIDTVSIKTSFH